MSARPLLVFFNHRSGTAGGRAGKARLESAFAAAGADATVLDVDERPFAERIAEHDPDAACAVVAAGGDGTLRGVAEALIDGPRPFGVLALGTRNHFAKDTNVPLDLAAAIDTLLAGRQVAVDAGEVEGHIFLNNASLGLYPRFVEERRRRMQESTRWAAIAGSAWTVIRRRQQLRVRFDGEPDETGATIVFVGNNPYHLEGIDLGTRPSVESGRLSFVLAAPESPIEAAQVALRALFGRLEDGRDLQLRHARELEIAMRRASVRVALDGETLRLTPPLRFRSRPGALQLLVPAEHA